MRIFFVSTEMIDSETLMPFDGGLASYLCKITTALYTQGHDVSVIVVNKFIEKEVLYRGVKVFFVPFINKNSLFDQIKWRLSSKAKRHSLLCDAIHTKLRQEHERKKIDVIQYASFQGLGSRPETDIPSCVRISSYSKLWQKNYNHINEQEVINEVEQFRKARFLFGPSEYVANYIKEDLKLTTEIKIIETPFVPTVTKEDDSLLSTLRDKIGHGEYLIFYGSIGLLKGAQEIADVIFETLSKYPNLHFVLVGKEKKIEGRLPIQIIREKACQFSNRVIHFDKTGHDKLFPLIKASKAVVLPSRIDNLPNACIEAMGLRKIVIGSRGASFEQLIDDGISGLLCDAGDAKTLQFAIDRLMKLNASEVDQMANAAYDRSRTLSLDEIVPQLLDYYHQVINKWEETK